MLHFVLSPSQQFGPNVLLFASKKLGFNTWTRSTPSPALATGLRCSAAYWRSVCRARRLAGTLENVGRCFAVVLLKGLRQKPLRRILSYPAQRFEGVVQGSLPLGQACARSTMPQPPTDY